MSYTMRLSDGSILAEVFDRTIDKDTLSISLVGRGSINYGTDIGEDLIHLLENFASPKAPRNPLYGQIWFDKSQNRMKFYAGIWKPFDGDATSLNIPNTVVKRDNAGSFEANIITANLKGIADSSKRWLTGRRLTVVGNATGAVVLDGSADVALNLSVQKADKADKWTTARVLSLGNQLRGTVTIDGATNVTLNASFKDGGIDTNINGNATTATSFQTPRQLTLSGDVNGSGVISGQSDTVIGSTLSNTGVNPGTYNVVAVDAKGRVVAGQNADYSAAKTADHAKTADYATRAGYADSAGSVPNAGRATSADYADNAGRAAYADEAGKLRPGRVIAIAGTVNGAAFFDGSSDITINVTGAAGANGSNGSQGQKGDKGDKGDPGQKGEKGDPGSAGAGGSTGSYYRGTPTRNVQGGGVVINCAGSGSYPGPTASQVIAQWDIDLTGSTSYILSAYQEGLYALNGLHGENRGAVGKVDLIINGTVVKTVQNVAAVVSAGGPTGSSATQLTFFDVTPASNKITVKCYGEMFNNGYTSTFSYTFGESWAQVMRF